MNHPTTKFSSWLCATFIYGLGACLSVNIAVNTQAAEPEAPKSKPVEFSVVIAEHVMLLEGREIVTWQDIEAKIAALPEPAAAYPHFKFTNAVFNTERYEAAKAEMYRLHETYEVWGHSEGSMWPRRGILYDRIKTPADLIPDPKLKVTGIVLDKANQPVADAEVVLVTPVDESISYKTYHMELVNGSVRNRLEHVMTLSDSEGKFELYPPSGQPYYIVALHPVSGFVMVDNQNFDQHHQCRLVHWAGLIAELDPAEIEKHETDLTTNIAEDAGKPEVTFNQYWSDIKNSWEGKVEDNNRVFGFICVPPLLGVTLSRSFPQEDGGSLSIPETGLELFPGETRKLNLGPATAAQREQIELLRNRFNPPPPAAAAP